MLKLRFAIIAAIGAFAFYNGHHYNSICSDTRNPALCRLNLDAGESDIVAHNAGNGIFN